MINGEETEKQECAGFKEVKNIQNENRPLEQGSGGVSCW